MALGDNPTYDNLVASLVKRFADAGAQDIRADRSRLPVPDLIDGQRPDATGVIDGGLLIGVARTGYQLEEPETEEALQAFIAAKGPDGERAVVHLCVPEGFRERGHAAFERAGGEPGDELNNVLTLKIPGVEPPAE